VSSLRLLAAVMDRVRAQGGRLVNVDATVICQAPRLAAFLPEMVRRLAEVLELGADRVSVKAKSPEHLGLLGREEGVAALAVVSVDAP
jgi:2-C-methyl-D-erythritol 2,4-cyclodiphosphate synthase